MANEQTTKVPSIIYSDVDYTVHILKELISVRDDFMMLNNFTYQEVNDLINFISSC